MLPSKWPIDAGMNILEEMPMEPASYFNMLLADPRITMLQILGMQRPLEVAGSMYHCVFLKSASRGIMDTIPSVV